jgi:SsrA-binding protein
MAKAKIEGTVSINNRQARYEYHIMDTYIAGIVLRGTEIKSIRQSKVQITDAFCQFKDDGLYVINLHISAYEQASFYQHAPRSDRKLLLKKVELRKLEKATEEKGNTLIPLKLFINDRGLCKIEIAVAKGKKLHDKRDDIKERDIKREMSRDLA